MNKRQEAELEEAELKMLRFSLGVMRMDGQDEEPAHQKDGTGWTFWKQ